MEGSARGHIDMPLAAPWTERLVNALIYRQSRADRRAAGQQRGTQEHTGDVVQPGSGDPGALLGGGRERDMP